MRFIVAVLLGFIALSCSQEDRHIDSFLSCDQIAGLYRDYEGEDLSCHFYYTLGELGDDYYIELNSRCADLSRPFVINSDCEDICKDGNAICETYLRNRTQLEVVFIED